MELEEYIEKYGKHSYLSIASDNPQYIDAYMFLFNKETAPCWGGPFKGGFAFGVLLDYTQPDCRGVVKELPSELLMDKIRSRKRQKELQNANTKRERKNIKMFYELPYEYATLERPIRVWLMGNDDTSYSKFYANLDEAREEFELLKASQPLDMFKDLLPLGFIFTN